MYQGFGSVTFYLADPDLLDLTGSAWTCIKNQNAKAGNLSTTLLIIGVRYSTENYYKTGQQNKETNFHNLTDLKACYVHIKIF